MFFTIPPCGLRINGFKQIGTLMRDLIWKKKAARISLVTLQYRKDRGGIAILHPKMYFLASQLQQLAG